MSSSSSTMTIPAPLRITSTVLDVRPAVPTRVLPTPSSPQGTCGRPETLSGCWRRPGRPSTLNCFSSWTQGVVEEEAVRRTVTVFHIIYQSYCKIENMGLFETVDLKKTDSDKQLILIFHLWSLTGGRMRYRGSSSNNPNLMYQEECDRRMRPSGGGGGGAGGSKDSRSGFNRDSRNSRDGDHSASSSSSSFRDRSRDRRNSYNSGSDQYQSYSGSGGYNSRSGGQSGGGGGQDQSSQPQGQFGQPIPSPLSGVPQPLMAQQFVPPQPPLMGFMGQPPYAFASPPPPPQGPPPPRK